MDSMSKHVFFNDEVINLIAANLVGANHQYSPRLTEWADGSKSVVLYAANSTNTSPPILIEVQHVADDTFLHHVVNHCQKINMDYGIVPVVLVFVINKTRDSIMRKATKDPKHSFLLKLPCFPWAKKCLVINSCSISNHLTNTSLPPLVALGAFIIAQRKSILEHNQRQDPTIQMLYTISKNLFIDENATVSDILSLCDTSESKLEESIKILEESAKTRGMNKRAIDYLNDNLEIIKSYRLKYTPSELTSASSSPASSSPASSPVSSPVSSPEPSPGPSEPVVARSSQAPESFNKNWKFVDSYIQSLKDGKMNWKACFLKGRRQGLFLNYANHISLKSAYQRWKKQQS